MSLLFSKLSHFNGKICDYIYFSRVFLLIAPGVLRIFWGVNSIDWIFLKFNAFSRSHVFLLKPSDFFVVKSAVLTRHKGQIYIVID